MRQTVGGVTLSIDNIAVDDSYMSIFFTVSSETPLEQVGTDSEPESWRAGWTAPVFRAVVNGTELDTTGKIDNEAYFADDCTLKGIHRLASEGGPARPVRPAALRWRHEPSDGRRGPVRNVHRQEHGRTA